MALTQIDIDDFLAKAKLVPDRVLKWQTVGKDNARWVAPVQLDRVSVGTIDAVYGVSVPRDWCFKLRLHEEEILRWDFHCTLKPIRHKNKRRAQCPAPFKLNISSHEHEHCWTEGMGCFCARDLPTSLANADHKTALERFCDHCQIEFGPAYLDPPAGEQITLA